jgi:hypothetical protein
MNAENTAITATLALNVVVENHATKQLEGATAQLTFGDKLSGAMFPLMHQSIIQAFVRLGFVPVWSPNTKFIRFNPAGGSLTGQESLPGVLCQHSTHNGMVYCKQPKQYRVALMSAGEVAQGLKAQRGFEVNVESAGKGCVRIAAQHPVDLMRALAWLYPSQANIYDEIANALVESERADNVADIAAASAAIDAPAPEIAPKKQSKKIKK